MVQLTKLIIIFMLLKLSNTSYIDLCGYETDNVSNKVKCLINCLNKCSSTDPHCSIQCDSKCCE